jgi:hypothetical protein
MTQSSETIRGRSMMLSSTELGFQEASNLTVVAVSAQSGASSGSVSCSSTTQRPPASNVSMMVHSDALVGDRLGHCRTSGVAEFPPREPECVARLFVVAGVERLHSVQIVGVAPVPRKIEEELVHFLDGPVDDRLDDEPFHSGPSGAVTLATWIGRHESRLL